MKIASLATLINRAFQFAIISSEKYHIDESHAVRHSLDVYHYASQIYNSELPNNPFLIEQQPVIYASAILHDMCDKKYMEESYGLMEIRDHMKGYMTNDHLDAMSDIISTMSYSKVMRVGYPDLDKYQLSYHIVREADLLSGYDVTRSMIYQLMHEQYEYTESLQVVEALFNKRMFKYVSENLFITDYSKEMANYLHEQAIYSIAELHNLQPPDPPSNRYII
jgi:HD superfamily phosphodiesterase